MNAGALASAFIILHSSVLHFLLIAIGSHGDVHPFVGLGIALHRRGHRVTIAANEHFQSLIERAGFEFVAIGTDAEFSEAKSNPDLWHWHRAAGTIMRMIAPLIRRAFQAGRTEVALDAAASLTAGVYWVRWRGEGAARSLKVVQVP